MKLKIPEYISLEDKSLLTVNYDKEYSYLAYNDNAVLNKIAVGNTNFKFSVEDFSSTYETYYYNNTRILSGQSLCLDIDMTDSTIFTAKDGNNYPLPFIFYISDNIYNMMTPQDVGSLKIRGKYPNDYNPDLGDVVTMDLTSISPTTVSTSSIILGGLKQEDPNVLDFKLNPMFLITPDIASDETDKSLCVIGGNISLSKTPSLTPYTVGIPFIDKEDGTLKSVSYTTGIENLGYIKYFTAYNTSNGNSTQVPSLNKINFTISDGSKDIERFILQPDVSLFYSKVAVYNELGVDTGSTKLFTVNYGSTELLSSSQSYFKTYSATSALLETPYSKVNLGNNDVTGLGQVSVSLTQGLNQPPVEVFRFYNDRLMPRSDNTTDLGHQDLCYRKVYTRSVDSGSNDLSLNVGGNLNINSPVVLNGTLNGVVLNSNSFEFNSTNYGITLPLFSCVEAIYETISSYADGSHTDINSTGGSSGTGISQLKTFLGNSNLYYNVSEAFPYDSYFGNASGYNSGVKSTSIQSTEVPYPPDASGAYSNPTKQARLYYITPYKSSYYIPITSVGKYRIRVLGTQYPINRISSSAWSECSSSNGVIYNNYGGVQTVLGSVPDLSKLCQDILTSDPPDYITLWKKSYYDSGTGRTWYLYCQSVRCLIFRYE